MNKSKLLHTASKAKTLFSVAPWYPLALCIKKVLYKLDLVGSPMMRALNSIMVPHMQRWFQHQFKDITDSYENVKETAVPFNCSDTINVWMCWIDGVDKIPQHYSPYIESIRRHNPNYQVRIVDLTTAQKLIDIPSIILERYYHKDISASHLTDFIRVSLLEKYGGIWMDMTLYQVRDTPDAVLQIPCWSVKGLADFIYASSIPSGREWQIYYIAGQRNALFYKVLRDLLISYSTRFSFQIDYFYTYYLAAIAREVPEVKASFSKVPSNNQLCQTVRDAVATDMPITAKTIHEFISNNTWIYKCTNLKKKNSKKRYLEILGKIDEEIHMDKEDRK